MGGPPPPGYDVNDKKLIVNAAEAQAVQWLFHLYLQLGSVRSLEREAECQVLVAYNLGNFLRTLALQRRWNIGR